MISPDEETLRAIMNLAGDERFRRVKVWMQKSLELAIRSLPENTVFSAGRVAEIEDMLRKIETAKEKFDDIQKAIGKK